MEWSNGCRIICALEEWRLTTATQDPILPHKAQCCIVREPLRKRLLSRLGKLKDGLMYNRSQLRTTGAMQRRPLLRTLAIIGVCFTAARLPAQPAAEVASIETFNRSWSDRALPATAPRHRCQGLRLDAKKAARQGYLPGHSASSSLYARGRHQSTGTHAHGREAAVCCRDCSHRAMDRRRR